MSTQFDGRIIAGQKVRDMDGNTLGEVAHIYREDVNATESEHDAFMEVTKGLFGLGQHLYIPVSVVADATDKEVQLGQVSEYASLQWRSKPERLHRLN